MGQQLRARVRDVLALEREVTQDIARQVQARLTTQNQMSVPQPRSINAEALEANLQGSYHMNSFGRGFGDEEKRKAAEYFQKAIDADLNFVPAYTGMSRAHSALV